MANSYGFIITALDFSDSVNIEGAESLFSSISGDQTLNTGKWVSIDNSKVLVRFSDTKQEAAQHTPPDTATSGSDLLCHFVGTQIVPGELLTPQNAGGLLISSLNIPAHAEDEFNDWCTAEHVARLAKVPGVLSARRYKTTMGVQRYVNVYHLASPEVQASEAWKEAVNTPWSTRLRPLFTDKLRIVCKPA